MLGGRGTQGTQQQGHEGKNRACSHITDSSVRDARKKERKRERKGGNATGLACWGHRQV